jgi:MraZ protein
MAEEKAVSGTRYYAVYEHLVDDKRRVQVPAKWRPPADQPELEFLLVLWHPKGQEHPCLLALPPPVLAALERKISDLAFSDLRAETLRRVITRKSDSVKLDSAGRICLPQRLAEAAGITRKAVLVGMLDRFQIWNPDHYKAVEEQDNAREQEALALI